MRKTHVILFAILFLLILITLIVVKANAGTDSTVFLPVIAHGCEFGEWNGKYCVWIP